MPPVAEFSGMPSLRRWSRRGFLVTWGVAGVGATLLSACGPQGVPAPASTSAPVVPPTTAPVLVPTAAPAAAAPAQAPTTAAPPAPTVAPSTSASTPKNGGTFRFYLWTEDAPTVDPYMNVTFRSQEFAAFFYSRLLMSKKGPGIASQAYVMEGDLAESWNISEDGLTYTFNLRPNATWHNLPPMNGRPVTAQDVVWSFERLMKVSGNRTAFDQVANVTAPDARTVQFQLQDNYVPFESLIGSPIFWIMPREVIEADGDAQTRVIGSGPFIFDKHDSGVSFSGRKNPNYYRPGEPRIDDFVAIIIPDTATQLAAFRSGQLDFYQLLSQQDIAPLKESNPQTQFVEWEYLNIPFVYWKVDQPPFNDPRVRQAVSMALNRDAMIDIVYAGRGNWNNFIPWGLSSWWLDPRGPDMGPGGKYFKYDPAEAKALLSAAGYPDGLKVEMVSTPGYGQVFVQMGELVQQDLKAIGIDAEIKMQEYSTYISTTFLGKFEGGNRLVWGLETPFTEPHDFLFQMYNPKGTRNHAGINDTKLTAMIDQQRKTLDRAERKKQILDIQRYLADQMYYPQHAAPMRTAALTPNVRDFFPRSDYGLGAEIIPKLWLDQG
jgi:peptide/nickel transport system substrate-binding protein